MANFNEKKKKNIIPVVLVLIIDILITPIFSNMIMTLVYSPIDGIQQIENQLRKPITFYMNFVNDRNSQIIFLLIQGIVLTLILSMLFKDSKVIKDDTETMKVANLVIPKAVGKGQMGTSRFSTNEEKEKYFKVWKEGDPLSSGGMIMGTKIENDKTYYYYDDDDINTLLIGTTRSGKSRREYLPSIYLLANSGESMFVNDPKGELYIYTNEYLKKMGYKVLNLDFRQPEKGMRYNYLHYILIDIKNNDLDSAVEKIWDLVGIFVGEAKGEKLWNNGEASVMASAIAYICLESPDDKYKNLTNVYYFIANYCKMNDEGEMKITKIYEKLPVDHPARAIFAVAELAAPRTRSSFFTSALSTLRLFTDNKIAYMTSDTEIDLNILGKEKVAFFCTIPDEKSTRDVLSTILIDQLYMNLVEVANENGGRLKNRVNMLIDEFGNLPKINGFNKKLTVCLGRGIRFILAVQGIAQLYDVYGKDIAEIITSNCHTWIYLLTTDNTTATVISKKTGTYTVQSKSVSSSSSSTGLKGSESISSSANLVKRNLLEPDEILRLDMPYSLVLKAKGYPSIFNLEDLSKLKPNKLYGMGNKEENIKLTIERENAREIRKIEKTPVWQPIITDDESEDDFDISDIEIKDNKPNFI